MHVFGDWHKLASEFFNLGVATLSGVTWYTYRVAGNF